jgi:hypothetical protein
LSAFTVGSGGSADPDSDDIVKIATAHNVGGSHALSGLMTGWRRLSYM